MLSGLLFSGWRGWGRGQRGGGGCKAPRCNCNKTTVWRLDGGRRGRWGREDGGGGGRDGVPQLLPAVQPACDSNASRSRCREEVRRVAPSRRESYRAALCPRVSMVHSRMVLPQLVVAVLLALLHTGATISGGAKVRLEDLHLVKEKRELGPLGPCGVNNNKYCTYNQRKLAQATWYAPKRSQIFQKMKLPSRPSVQEYIYSCYIPCYVR